MPRAFFTRERYYDDDDGQPQGGGAEKVRASDLRSQLGSQVDEQALMRLLEKQAELLSDNAKLREQRRTLREEKTALEKRTVPEGARVLTAEEAQAYDAYAALGAPEAVQTALEASKTSVAELASLRRAERIRAAAEAAGYKPSVLTQLAGDLDIQTKEKDGKAIPIVVADGKETPLADYAKTHWSDFLPSLAPTGRVEAPDINAGARGNGNTPVLTEAERDVITRRYRATF
jgi:hypothetical protein